MRYQEIKPRTQDQSSLDLRYRQDSEVRKDILKIDAVVQCRLYTMKFNFISILMRNISTVWQTGGKVCGNMIKMWDLSITASTAIR